MRTATMIILIVGAIAIGGCSTARGTIRAIREIGSGILIDGEAIIDGIAERDKAETIDSEQ